MTTRQRKGQDPSPHEVLATWASLNKHIQELSEDRLKGLIHHELATERRAAWVKRLYHRMSALRRDREMKALGEQLGVNIR